MQIWFDEIAYIDYEIYVISGNKKKISVCFWAQK